MKMPTLLRLCLLLLLCSLSCLSLGCGAGARAGQYQSELSTARHAGRASSDADVVGRWLLAELISPGGHADAAKNARKRLDELDQDGATLGHLARGLDDEVHGRLRSAPEHYLRAVKAARGEHSELAPLIGWFAAHRAVALRHNAPGLYERHRELVRDVMLDPVSLGWRARGEFVEWWADEAYSAGTGALDEKSQAAFGCVSPIRMAGPFGRGTAPDSYRSFPAELPGPWPTRFPQDPTRATVPQILKVEQRGCFARAEDARERGIFYAETYLELDGDRELIIAAQGALAVFVNDTQVLDRDPRKWGVWPKFGVQVWLPKGRHRVLVRLSEPQTSIRVLAPGGAPAKVKASADPSGLNSVVAPRVTADPNVLVRYVDKGRVRDPGSDLTRFLAAFLAFIEGQGDVATVLSEPLLKEPARPTGPILSLSAGFVERDPLFDRTQLADLARELHTRAAKRDPELWQSALALAAWEAERAGPTEATKVLRRLVERFPQVPTVLLALARVYGELGWSAEYLATAKELAKKFPQDEEALTLAIGVLDSTGEMSAADAYVERILKLNPESEIRLSRALGRSDYAAALDELKRLHNRRPERKDLAERISDVMIRAGDRAQVWKKLEAALEQNPRSGPHRLALADARFAKGDRAALRQAVVDAIVKGAPTSELEDALDLVEGSSQLEPFRIDALDVIRKYEASNRHLTGTAARILDYAAIWVHPNGSSRMLEHEVIRIQSPEAIGKLAEHPRLEGIVLHMRVIKKDGRILEPEIVPGKPTVTFPHLEVGDYLETEHVVTRASESPDGTEYLGPHWFFREENIAYARSELVFVTPADKKLIIETRGKVPAPSVKEMDGLVMRRWRVDESPAAPAEPGSAPITEFLPSVRLGWGVRLDSRLLHLADNLTDVTPIDPRIVRIAQRIVAPLPKRQKEARARRLYRWVLENVEDGKETDGRRVIVGKNGNRWRGFSALCRAVGIQADFAVARNRLAPKPASELERASQFAEPLLRITTEKGAVWLTLASKFAPFGYVPVEIRGVPAYALVDPKPVQVTTPVSGTEDSVVYDGDIKLAANGSAKLTLSQRFTGKYAMAIRAAIAQLSEAQLRDVVESRLLGRALRGAHLDRFEFEGRDDLDAPLVLKMKANMSAFAQVTGGELMIAPPFSPQISQLATLPERETPLLIGETTHQEVTVRIHLPTGATALVPPPQTVKQRDMEVQVKDRSKKSVITLDRNLSLPAGRVQPGEYAAFVAFARRADDALNATIRVRLR